MPEMKDDNDVVVSRYLRDGVLVVNLDHFNYTLGMCGKELPILADAPAATVLGLEMRCGESALVVDGQCVAKPDPTPAGSNELSSGAVRGIVIGAVALVLAIAAVLYWVWRRRNRYDAVNQDLRTDPMMEQE
jgi:hypothetical protein